MRRCGKALCVVLVGILAAATVAGGAFAAAGGQGKGHGAAKSQGQAKGHAKHAVAAPQLSPQPVVPAEPGRAKKADVSPSREDRREATPGPQTKRNHLTICHRTGSGRYIVISPNVNGAMNGHLKHHDDFVYVDGCERPTPAPRPDPAPEPSPKPPPEGTTAVDLPVQLESARPLPFTGLPIWIPLLAGAGLLAGGLMLRRQARSTR